MKPRKVTTTTLAEMRASQTPIATATAYDATSHRHWTSPESIFSSWGIRSEWWSRGMRTLSA